MFGLSRVERRADQWEATIRGLTERRLAPSYAGVSANYEEMISIPAVWKALLLTAGVVSVMPVNAYRDLDDERSELPTLPRLLREPSANVSFPDWVFQIVESMIMHGDAVGVIVSRDNRLTPTQIEIVDPKIVSVKLNRSTGTYDWFVDRKPVPDYDIWHLPGRPKLGTPFGVGLIEKMAQTAGIAIAARKYEAQWYGDGAHPTSIIRPEIDPGPVGAQALKDKILSIVRGNREPLILPPKTEFDTLQADPVTSALLDALRHNSTDIAHFVGIPPELVGGSTGDSMTYSNTEGRVIDLLTFGVQFWMSKLEYKLSKTIAPRPVYVKFDEEYIKRTDVRTKVETLIAQVAGGLLTQNEARNVLNRQSLPGGDVLFPPKGQQQAQQPPSPQPQLQEQPV
jgi:HK97 family phage portal protein